MYFIAQILVFPSVCVCEFLCVRYERVLHRMFDVTAASYLTILSHRYLSSFLPPFFISIFLIQLQRCLLLSLCLTW